MPDLKNVQKAAATSPDPVDIYVGSRICYMRKVKGMTQEDLAKEIGVTYQQLQKYEKGENRVSASRLYKIAEKLGVGVEFFFEGYDELEVSPIITVPTHTQETTAFMWGMAKIREANPDTYLKIKDLVFAINGP